jgi:hypothetical protein
VWWGRRGKGGWEGKGGKGKTGRWEVEEKRRIVVSDNIGPVCLGQISAGDQLVRFSMLDIAWLLKLGLMDSGIVSMVAYIVKQTRRIFERQQF